jgi:hypothetical protein
MGAGTPQRLHVVQALVVLSLDAETLFGSPAILFMLDPVGVRLIRHTAWARRAHPNLGKPEALIISSAGARACSQP